MSLQFLMIQSYSNQKLLDSYVATACGPTTMIIRKVKVFKVRHQKLLKESTQSYNYKFIISALFCSDACEKSFTKSCANFQANTSSVDQKMNRCFMSLKLYMKILEHFGSEKKMKEFVDENQNEKLTIFDFDWRDRKPSIADVFKMILGTSESKDRTRPTIPFDALPTISSSNFTKMATDKIYDATEVMKQLNVVMFVHCFNFCNYLHPAMLLLNHSCNPNIVMKVTNSGKVTWIVSRPIPVNGQIFTNYTPEFYTVNQTQPCTYQNCQPCREKWRDQIDFDEVKKEIPKWTSSAQMNHLKFVESCVLGFNEYAHDLNFIFPDDGTKPANLTLAAIRLSRFNFCLEVLECPFLTVKFADFAANQQKGTDNYIL